MALFANANSARGSQFKPEDFMPRKYEPKTPMNDDEVFAKFDAIFSANKEKEQP